MPERQAYGYEWREPPARRADNWPTSTRRDLGGIVMTAINTERPVVRVTCDTTKAELAETISLLNDNAKRIHRRGYIGTASEAYVLAHARINALLSDWEDAPA